MRAFDRTHGAIFLVAVLAYLPGFWWGAPHATADDRRKAWGVDDEPPLGPLAQLYDMLTPGVAADANLGYPMLHSYIVLGAYAPYLGALRATGKLSEPTSKYPYGFSDPVTVLRRLSLIAHLVSVLMGAGVVLAAFVTAKSFWGDRAGWWAAVFTLLSYPMFYYARTSNVDVPVLFFVAWSLAALAEALTRGITSRRLAIFGILVGLAVATKEPIAALYLGLPIVLLVPTADWPGFRAPSRIGRALAVVVACGFVAYAAGSGMLFDFARWKAHIGFGMSVTQRVSEGSVAFMPKYPQTAAGNWHLALAAMAKLRDAMTLPGLLLALAGAGLAVRERHASRWLLMGVATYLLVLLLGARVAHLHYVMPVTLILALFAGRAAATFTSDPRPVIRYPVMLASAATVLITLSWASNLTYAMWRDSRYAAGDWLLTIGRPGDRLEYFGAFQKNPPLPVWMHSDRAIDYEGGEHVAPRDAETVARIMSGWSARKPRFIVLTPDHTSIDGEPYASTCPPKVFEALESGSIGYAPARLFQTPPLISFLPRPRLDYDPVNPPVRIYVINGDPAGEER